MITANVLKQELLQKHLTSGPRVPSSEHQIHFTRRCAHSGNEHPTQNRTNRRCISYLPACRMESALDLGLRASLPSSKHTVANWPPSKPITAILLPPTLSNKKEKDNSSDIAVFMASLLHSNACCQHVQLRLYAPSAQSY